LGKSVAKLYASAVYDVIMCLSVCLSQEFLIYKDGITRITPLTP